MKHSYIKIWVENSNLFDPTEKRIFWTVPDDKDLSGSAPLTNFETQKSWIIRQVLRTQITALFNGRKPALQIQGYATERHLLAIDRLNGSIRTLQSINEYYSFLSYTSRVIIPDLWKLCPGPSSPFKNYRQNLEKISAYIQSELINQMQKVS